MAASPTLEHCPGTLYMATAWRRMRQGLEAPIWRKRKGGYAWRRRAVLHNGIVVARVHGCSMLTNTCCTTLLMQGAPAESTTCPG